VGGGLLIEFLLGMERAFVLQNVRCWHYNAKKMLFIDFCLLLRVLNVEL
jgi:hypothetical protein